jgi:ABC-2 type transport system permease protein
MKWKPYLTVFRIRVLAVLQYRAALLAKLVPPVFVGLVQAMFFTAFFRGSSADQPLTLAQTITYCWLIQMLVGVQPWSGDPEVLQIIRNGNIAYELCRPVDLYFQWFSRLAAHRLVPLLLSSVPLAVVGRFLVPTPYRMAAPASAAACAAFLLALAGVVMMSSALSNLLGILTVWTVSGEGLYYLAPMLFTVLSGAIVPLPLWPPKLQWLLNLLPFRALIDTPAQVYLGLISPARTLPLVGGQLIWTVAFVLVGRHLLGKAIKSVVVQGG